MLARSAAALLCAAGLALGACATGEGTAEDSAVAPGATSSTASTDTSLPAPADPAIDRGCPSPDGVGPSDAGPHAVGRTVAEFVDTSRPTAPGEGSDAPAADQRTLPAVVLYPAAGDPGEPGTHQADAAPADGSFPLVVYSHGVSSDGTERNDALARWAAAGYVVVAPTFPLSSLGFDISDLPNQPLDVVFVAEQFRAAVADPTDPLHRTVRSDCLALIGHSMGAATTFAAAFDPCCEELEPVAVVGIAGVLVPVTPGAELRDAAPLPTLIVHGVLDATVSHEHAGNAAETVAAMGAPVWTVSITGGAHSSMFEPPEVDVLTASVVAFLDAQLKGAPAALERLPELIDREPLATLAVSEALPR